MTKRPVDASRYVQARELSLAKRLKCCVQVGTVIGRSNFPISCDENGYAVSSRESHGAGYVAAFGSQHGQTYIAFPKRIKARIGRIERD